MDTFERRVYNRVIASETHDVMWVRDNYPGLWDALRARLRDGELLTFEQWDQIEDLARKLGM